MRRASDAAANGAAGDGARARLSGYRRSLVEWLRRESGHVLARIRTRLDAHAEAQKTAWGASVEYKRRYTNPDDAKRQRRRSGDAER